MDSLFFIIFNGFIIFFIIFNGFIIFFIIFNIIFNPECGRGKPGFWRGAFWCSFSVSQKMFFYPRQKSSLLPPERARRDHHHITHHLPSPILTPHPSPITPSAHHRSQSISPSVHHPSTTAAIANRSIIVKHKSSGSATAAARGDAAASCLVGCGCRCFQSILIHHTKNQRETIH
jgi:hypothetical protein